MAEKKSEKNRACFGGMRNGTPSRETHYLGLAMREVWENEACWLRSVDGSVLRMNFVTTPSKALSFVVALLLPDQISCH